jgi:hypothetical protein
MSNPTQWEVTYSLLVESRTDTFLGSSRSDVQNLKMVVNASSSNQASQMVQSMNGGYANCLVHSAYPLY